MIQYKVPHYPVEAIRLYKPTRMNLKDFSIPYWYIQFLFFMIPQLFISIAFIENAVNCSGFKKSKMCDIFIPNI